MSWVLVGALAGCAGADDGSGRARKPPPNSFGNAATGGNAGTFGKPNAQAGTRSTRPPTGGTTDIGEVCDADVYSGLRKRLDIYMMVDDSGSMVPWWYPTLEAINMFYRDPASEGIGVGLKFFGSACEPERYAAPVVPIMPLPTHVDMLEVAFPLLPVEGTATLPAMQGAIMHARSWATEHPDAKTVVLLVTDGLPDDCNSTVENVTQVVAEGLSGDPSIQTFVVGLGDITALDQFAAAGGTDKALVVEPGAMQQLTAALNQIRNAALPCEFKLPEGNGGAIQPDRVNLRYTDPAGTQQTIGAVASQGACDATQGGWYYDDPATPTQLIACAKSCEQLNAGGEVKVLLGCPTVRVVPE